jgi:iron complex outermembrane receptor protein
MALARDRLTLRGENSGGVGSTVAIYIDDSPIGSSTALANGGIYTADIDPWDLQRIEVLRGPQGTLYGAGSEGGLIKFVANQPNPNQLEGAVEVGGEQVDHGQGAGSVKGMVNLPLLDGKAALRISAFGENLPGYISDPQLGRENVNHGSKAGFRAALLVKPTDDLSIKLTAFNQDSRIEGLPNVDVVGASLSYASPPGNIFQPLHGDLSQDRFIGEYQKSEVSNYSADVSWNFDWASLTSITSYGTERFSNLVDQTSTEAAPGLTYGALISSAITGVPTGLLETGVLPLQKWTEEIRLASSPSDKWEWQVGAFYTHEHSNYFQVLTDFNIPQVTPQSGPVAGGAALPATYEEWAGFGDLTYHFNSHFDVAIGGRYSANDQHATTIATPGTLTGPASSSPASSSGDDFTYSVAPRWHVNSDTMIYTRIATGYRPGGPNNVPPAASPSVPRIYSSDSTINYEVGFRTDLFEKRLSIDIATFYIDWSKIQLNEVVDNVGITSNGGSARSTGVEWTLGVAPIQGLNVSLVGAYIDAKLTDDAPGVGGHDGDRLPFAPAVSTSLDSEYKWPLLSNYTAFVGGTYSFVGSRYTNFSTIAYLDPHTKLPSYNTTNLRTGVRWERWTAEVYAKNVADARGLTGYSNSGTPNLGGSVGIIQPRTFGVTLSAKF